MLMRRTAVGALGVTALVAGALAPATASATPRHDSDELRVKVCKKYDGDDHQRFRFNSWTHEQEDNYNFWLRKDDCTWYKLDYDKNYYHLYERNGDDYDVRYRVSGDKHWAHVDHGKLTVKFKKNHDPYLQIWVYNYEDDHHDDDDRR